MKASLWDVVLFLSTFNRQIHFVSLLYSVIVGNVHYPLWVIELVQQTDEVFPLAHLFSLYASINATYYNRYGSSSQL